MGKTSFELRAETLLQYIQGSEFLNTSTRGGKSISAFGESAVARFVGGATLDDSLEAVRKINERGIAVAINYISERAPNRAAAVRETGEFVRIVQAIEAENLMASVSLDLSQIGLFVDDEFFFENAVTLVQDANDAGVEVMISNEGSEHMDKILSMHEHLCHHFDDLGVTLQAYLPRTSLDLAVVMRRPGRIRLVKGAYEGLNGIAAESDPDVAASYRSMMATLLDSQHACLFAIHDSILLDEAHTYIRDHNLKVDQIEFEMPYGVAEEQLQRTRDRGYKTCISLSYGPEWFSYLMRRRTASSSAVTKVS